MRKFKSSLAKLVIFALVLTHGELTMAIEEPTFVVVEKSENIEIRQYQPVIVAEAFVDGDMATASNKGFRLIADYIFGNNQTRRTASGKESEKIAMTAPVMIEPVVKSEKIAMTTPVTIASAENNNSEQVSRWRIRFVMPSAYTMATLPKPVNSEVTLREVPAKRYAVLTFSGLAGEEKVQHKTGDLMDYLRTQKLESIGQAQLARYNPPWTIPFLRRNEILIEITVP